MRKPMVRHGILPVVAASIALLVAACGGGAASSTQRSQPTTAQSHSSTAARHSTTTTASATGVAAAMLDYMFPRSGADWSVGTQYLAFMQGVKFKTETRCLAASGLPEPPTNLTTSAPFYQMQSYGSADMPNLPLIERTKHLGDTIEIPAGKSPTASMSKAERTAYNAALKRCSAAPTKLFDFLHGGAQALQEQWLNTIAQVEAEPSVRAANRKAQRCSQGTGFAANSVENETSAIEGKSTPLNIRGERAQVMASEAKGTRVLVRCFGPAIVLTQKLLTKRRATFFDQNATALTQLQDEMNDAVATIERRYGLKPQAAEQLKR